MYLENKKEHVERVVKPLRDRKERVYVIAGSEAESRARQNPHKEVRIVPGMLRSRTQTPEHEAGSRKRRAKKVHIHSGPSALRVSIFE